MARLAPQFSSNRMVREYVERMYLPAAAAYQRRSADHGQLAKELHEWWTTLQAHWHEVHFGAVEVSQEDDGWAFRVRVYLGEIPATSVRVELYADPTDGEAPLRTEMERGDRIPGAINGYIYHACISTARPAADFTPRVVPYHPEARVPTEAPLICWQR
jgi:starch phosphorylase